LIETEYCVWNRRKRRFKYSHELFTGVLPGLARAKEAKVPQLISKTEGLGKWACTVLITALHWTGSSHGPPESREPVQEV